MFDENTMVPYVKRINDSAAPNRRIDVLGGLPHYLSLKIAEETGKDPVPLSLYGALAHLGAKWYYKNAQARMIREGIESYAALVQDGALKSAEPLPQGNGLAKMAHVVRAIQAVAEPDDRQQDEHAALLKRAADATVTSLYVEKIAAPNWSALGQQFVASPFAKGLGAAAGAGVVAAPVALGVGAHLRDTTMQQAEERTNNAIRNAAIAGTGATLTTMLGKKMIDRALPDRPNVPQLTGAIANNVTPMARAQQW